MTTSTAVWWSTTSTAAASRSPRVGPARSPHEYATARLDAERAATYEFDLAWELADASLPDHDRSARRVARHGDRAGREAVLGLLDEAADRDLLVTYDPNVRAGLLPTWHDVASVAARVDVVKMSDEDVAHLRPEESVQGVARELLANGRTHLVVVTRGGLGAMAFTAHGNVEVVAPRTVVVDTVGDSFMAALIAVPRVGLPA